MPPDFPAAPTTHAARRPSVLGAYSTAVLLLGSLTAARRLRSELVLLLTFAGAIAVDRLVGLALDGPAPFTLWVLKPELGLVRFSSLALFTSASRTDGPLQEPGHASLPSRWSRRAPSRKLPRPSSCYASRA